MFGEFFKKYEKWSLLTSILMLIFAIFLIIKPLESLSTFITIFGVILIVDSIICFVNYFKTDAQIRMMSLGLIEGLLTLLAGITIIITSNALTAFLPIMLAIWIIIKSLISFQYAINLATIKSSGWGWNLTMSILTFIFGVIIIFNPFASATVATATVGVFLAITEIINIIESIITIIKMKKM